MAHIADNREEHTADARAAISARSQVGMDVAGVGGSASSPRAKSVVGDDGVVSP